MTEDWSTSDASGLLVSSPQPGIALITISRERSANTISTALSRELLQLVGRLTADAAVRAVILTGAGRFFCAGADLRDPELGPRSLQAGRQALDAFAQLPIPTIAAVNGPALGGGTELALTCDFRIAASTATFGLPEIKIGALPGAGGLTRLQHLVGPSRAKELIFTGRPVPAVDALQAGLVSQVVPQDTLLATCLELAAEIAQYAPYAIRTAKLILDQSLGTPTTHALASEYRLIDTMATPEQQAEARSDAARRDPAYARIFGTPPVEGSTPTAEQRSALPERH